MQHLKWEKAGRVFSHADEGEPQRFTFKTSLGQQNVDLGGAQFAPYVWDSANKTIKFSDCELRFTATGLEFWQGIDKLNTLAFHPEYKQGGNWRRRAPGIGALSVQEIDSGNSKVELKISYLLTTQDSETEVFVRVGYNSKVHFGTRFKAIKAGVEQRVSVEFAEKFDAVEESDKQGNVLPTSRLKSAKTWWAWDRSEEADHEIEQTTITKVHLGRKVYALNEERTISPDTIAPTLNANGDDGTDSSGWNISGFAPGSTNFIDADTHIGLSFVFPGALASSVTVDKMYARMYQSYDSPSGSCVFKSLVENSDPATAAQWGSAHLPRNGSWIRANGNQTRAFADNTWYFGEADTHPLNLAADLQDILTSFGDIASGNRLNFAYLYQSGGYGGFEDYNDAGTNEAELLITYTAGGGGVSIPVVMANYRERRV